jgi:L-glutamine-phosphate cytidylyltransferase
MEALILAAGEGSRLGVSVPKCLVEVGGQTLLDRQLSALEAAGAEEITVVVGHERDLVREVAGDRAHLVVNECYGRTNSLYSFWLARHFVTEDLLLLNSDVLFPEVLLRRLLAAEGSALAYDSSSGGDEEHMKVRLRWGRLERMSKKLAQAETAGENVGVIRLAPADAVAAFAAADWLVREGCRNEWVGAAISDVARRHTIRCLDVADLPWVEIDFPEDLSTARDVVWPEILALEAADRCDPHRNPHRVACTAAGLPVHVQEVTR